MAGLNSLGALLHEELRDMYDAEKQLTRALPKLARKATSPDLRRALKDHLRQTVKHVERLERAFEMLDLPARGKKCVAMQNLIKEGDEAIGEAHDTDARDAIVIASAQKVEHYEIASYGTARTWAFVLGKDEVVSLLEETLKEEKKADGLLTGIAKGHVNVSAARGNGAVTRRSMRVVRGAGGRTMGRGLSGQAADRGQRISTARRNRPHSRFRR